MKNLLLVASIIFSAVLGWIAYMLADNTPPYIYDAERSFIKPDPATGGKQVLVHWQFKTVNRICPGFIYRTIVDATTGIRITYDPVIALGTIKLTDTYLERTFHLPEEMAAGPKIYRTNSEFACNPLQRIFPLKTRSPDIHFDVK